LAIEAVDLSDLAWLFTLSTSGSTIKSIRESTTISATDTSLASGVFGLHHVGSGVNQLFPVNLVAPASPLPQAQSIIEVDLEGSGKPEDPFRPSLSRNLVEVSSLTGLPEFLYREAKKYYILKAKGFTEDEIEAVFGGIQHQVDLDSVTWGAFELNPDKASTVIVTIIGDNPYSAGAIDRQKSKAKRVFTPPKSYDEAVSLYNTLVKDYPHWLAGKDNFAYECLGLEVFDYLQNVDFYYGELIEHKTHYDQLKKVPDWELRNRFNELKYKLSRVNVLVDERDKHLGKLNEILKVGW